MRTLCASGVTPIVPPSDAHQMPMDVPKHQRRRHSTFISARTSPLLVNDNAKNEPVKSTKNGSENRTAKTKHFTSLDPPSPSFDEISQCQTLNVAERQLRLRHVGSIKRERRHKPEHYQQKSLIGDHCCEKYGRKSVAARVRKTPSFVERNDSKHSMQSATHSICSGRGSQNANDEQQLLLTEQNLNELKIKTHSRPHAHHQHGGTTHRRRHNSGGGEGEAEVCCNNHYHHGNQHRAALLFFSEQKVQYKFNAYRTSHFLDAYNLHEILFVFGSL